MQTARDVFESLITGRSYFTCEVCGNEYDKPFEVHIDGQAHLFDCFECAIQALAPVCANCGCRILGHGMEAQGVFFCCAHCAKEQGVYDLDDRPTPERERSLA